MYGVHDSSHVLRQRHTLLHFNSFHLHDLLIPWRDFLPTGEHKTKHHT